MSEDKRTVLSRETLIPVGVAIATILTLGTFVFAAGSFVTAAKQHDEQQDRDIANLSVQHQKDVTELSARITALELSAQTSVLNITQLNGKIDLISQDVQYIKQAIDN